MQSSSMKKNIINFTEKSSLPSDIVTCNFAIFDQLRQDIKSIVHEINPRKKNQKGRQPTYDYSRFYVGRYITGISFQNIYLKNKSQMNRLLNELMVKWPNLNYFCVGYNLRIYIRAETVPIKSKKG